MAKKIVFLNPIPARHIVLWDAKYRKEGGSYPSLADKKIRKWKREIEGSLRTGNRPQTGTIAGPKISHINGAIAEINSHRLLVRHGHYSILAPGRTTAGGVDYITYFHYGKSRPANWRKAAWKALVADRVVGRIFRWPMCEVTG